MIKTTMTEICDRCGKKIESPYEETCFKMTKVLILRDTGDELFQYDLCDACLRAYVEQNNLFMDPTFREIREYEDKIFAITGFIARCKYEEADASYLTYLKTKYGGLLNEDVHVGKKLPE